MAATYDDKMFSQILTFYASVNYRWKKFRKIDLEADFQNILRFDREP